MLPRLLPPPPETGCSSPPPPPPPPPGLSGPLQEDAEAAEFHKKQLTTNDRLQETSPSPNDCLCRRLLKLLPLTRSS